MSDRPGFYEEIEALMNTREQAAFNEGFNTCLEKLQAFIDSNRSKVSKDVLDEWVKMAVNDYDKSRRTYWVPDSDSENNDLMLVDELHLSIRNYNVLKREGIHTIGDIRQKSLSEIIDFRNFAAVAFRELLIKMKEYGYQPVTRSE